MKSAGTAAPDPIAAALAEDLGSDGDVTSVSFVPAGTRARARIHARQTCTLAGIHTAAEVFRKIDPHARPELLAQDGASLNPGDAVLEIEGAAHTLLAGERTALNFVQRLSGIATLTRRFVDAIAGTNAKILDTRKTTPGLRVLEKAAVAAGGGTNHRMGLFDMALVKDNHLAVTGGNTLQAQIDAVRAQHPGIRVELEADTLDQVRSFLELQGVDFILLDNMPPEILREAVRITAGKVALEASGGITLETVRPIAETGVDFISVGALTHSAPAADFGFDFQTE